MERVLIGLGSNQGDSVEICLSAIRCLAEHSRVRLVKRSSLYRTAPLPLVDQPWFINGVVLCETDLSALELLDVLHAMERDFGRVRHLRWGPRTLDLDLLAFGEHHLSLPSLTVPHPRLHERRFVLEPLVEVDPDWVHPTLKSCARELLTRILDGMIEQEVERVEMP